MRNLLSIFSFDTLESFPIPTKSFCLGFVLFLIISVFYVQFDFPPLYCEDVAIYLSKYKSDPDKYQQDALLIGGSSRLLAIDPDLLSESLNIPTIYIPVSAGSPWEMMQIIKRDPDAFRNVRMIVMDIQPYAMNYNFPDVFQGGRTYYFYKGWCDFQKPAKNCAWFFSLIKYRIAFGGFLRIGNQRLTKHLPPPMNATQKSHTVDKINTINEADARRYADRFMIDFQYSHFMENTVKEIVKYTRENDIKLVLVNPPATHLYVDQLKTKDPENYERFRASYHSFEKEKHVRAFFSETFDGETPDSDTRFFFDYGHMKLEGAQKYTSWLAEKFKEDETLLENFHKKP